MMIYFFDGTGDSGDSVHHYLYARYAPDHPALFFDHWAKPLFVLLSSPFAQFGFTGMKVFNALVSLLTIFFTLKTCVRIGIKNTALLLIFFVCAPVSFALTFSGLTEPLFALLLILGVYFCVQNKLLTAAIVISFLPFVRSEGLIICGVFAFYFMVRKAFKLLPFLLLGHLVYSVAGYFVHRDILWVFTKIPYAHISSVYGNGGPFHFVNELAYLIGIPIYALMGIGTLVLIWKSLRKQSSLEIQVLVGLGFLGFFVAHSLFWYLGIFNSMGLKRVFIGVMPLMVILALYGFNFVVERSGKAAKIVSILLLLLVLVFPFTANHAALHVEQDLMLTPEQRTAQELCTFVRSERGTAHRFLYSHPYLSLALDIDHFDQSKHFNLSPQAVQWCYTGDIIIWDSWFGVVESGVTREFLDTQENLRLLKDFHRMDGDRRIEFAVFERI